MFFLRRRSGPKGRTEAPLERKAPKGLTFGGVWCNWQHEGFWFPYSRFESWYPSAVQQ